MYEERNQPLEVLLTHSRADLVTLDNISLWNYYWCNKRCRRPVGQVAKHNHTTIQCVYAHLYELSWFLKSHLWRIDFDWMYYCYMILLQNLRLANYFHIISFVTIKITIFPLTLGMTAGDNPLLKCWVNRE